MNRLAVEIVAVLVLIGGFALWERHQGAANCVQANVVAEGKQETHNAVVTALNVQTISFEKDAYADAKLVPVIAPAVFCVRKYATPAALSAAAGAGPNSDGGSGLPEGAGGSVQPVTDISTAAVTIGRDANAQVKVLKDYIVKVCEVPR